MHMAVHHDHDGDRLAKHDSRPLYLMTALLGALIAADLLLGWAPVQSIFPQLTNEILGFRLALIAAVIGGSRVLYLSLEVLLAGEVGSDLALALAAIAAILIGEPLVAAEVVFIAMLGESLEAITFGRTQKELRDLLHLRPHMATVLRDGQQVRIHTEDLVVGDRVLVRPGERIPADGTVVVGQTSVDQSALTGESIPVDKGPGDQVFTGTLNQHGAIEFTAEKVGADTTFGQLLHLIRKALERKAPVEKTADRYARYFLPIVLACAAVTFLFTSDWHRTVAILVVACPCGLVLATPAAVLAAVARLARQGVVLRGGIALERLAQATALVFDKTGTLTEGKPALGSIKPLSGHDEAEVLWCAATAEQQSEHVLAEVIREAAKKRDLQLHQLEQFEAFPGAGVHCVAGQEQFLVGNRRLLEQHGIAISEELEQALAELDESGHTSLIVVRNGTPVGVVGLHDRVRPEAHDVIHELKHLGFKDIALVTGDRWATARAVAKKVHIKEVQAEQLPADKAAFIEKWRQQGKVVAMIGDGINDAPALAVSDVGLALGGVGSNIAAEAGDVVLMRDPLDPLAFTVRISRQTLRIIKQNIIVFAFLVNATAILLSAWGYLPPIGAAIYHQIGSFLVLLNAMRLLMFERWHEWSVLQAYERFEHRMQHLAEDYNLSTLLDWLSVHWRKVLTASALAAIVGYVGMGLHVVEESEIGVLRRFGKFQKTLDPGFYWRFPPPFETVATLKPRQTQVLEVGFRSVPSAGIDDFENLVIEWTSPHRDGILQPQPQEALMLTGDENMVELNVAVQYRVSDVHQYLFGTNAPEQALRAATESLLRTLAAQTSETELLTVGRQQFEQTAQQLLQERVGVQGYNLGIEVVAVTLKDVHPPLEVVGAYHDVSSAMEEREQMINVADAYGESAKLLAESEVEAIINKAEGYRVSTVERSQAQLKAFLDQQLVYQLHPMLTQGRLFLEAAEQALGDRDKIVFDPKASSHKRILLSQQGNAGQLPTFLVDPTPQPAMPKSATKDD